MSVNIKQFGGELSKVTPSGQFSIADTSGVVKFVSTEEEYKNTKDNIHFIWAGETQEIDGHSLVKGTIYYRDQDTLNISGTASAIIPIKQPDNLVPGMMWLVRG